MSGRENEGSWGSSFLKGASVVAALLSSSSSANPQLQSPFAAGLGYKEDDQKKVWRKPETGSVKLNVDGSRDHEGPYAGCGGVLRNASGKWLLGFAQKLDSSYEVQDTELHAILVGMQLARGNWESMKVENLIVESDNEDVVKMVMSQCKLKKKHLERVKDIWKLVNDPNWKVKFVYIDRRANGVANRLARKARSLNDTDLQKYPPEPLENEIETLYLKDLAIEAKSERIQTHLHKETVSGRENEGSWGSSFLKGASVVAASAVVAGGLYALLSSSSSANPQLQSPFAAGRGYKEDDRDDGAPFSPHPVANSQEKVWRKPEIGSVKLNVDGSGGHEGPSAGCGGVLRNESGIWLLGFEQKLGSRCDAQETELHAILVGMQLARENWESMKVENLIVESDNDDVVKMVKGQCKLNKDLFELVKDVLEDIRKLVNDPNWNVEFVPIHRDANGVANGLARKARFLSSTALQDYPSPPDKDIKTLYLKDLGIELGHESF